MGPTNIALVKLFQAEQGLRAAQARLDDESRSVRAHERKVNDLAERSKLSHTKLMEAQSQAAQLDLDIKTRDGHIEKLRAQQQNSKNLKEYQAFLNEINIQKTDKTKVEDDLLKAMEQIESLQKEDKELAAQLAIEKERHAATVAQLSGRLSELKAEVDRLRPERDAAAAAVPARALTMFERLADRYDGEAMSAIGMPDRRREEYVCTACQMDVVPDIYNKLHSRDELVCCPNCLRLMYIPADLPPEMAISKPKEKKPSNRKGKDVAVGASRQTSAADISRSISAAVDDEEEEDPPATPQTPQS